MPLGARDVLIMVRATDMASATLTRIGGAFGAMGTGAAAAGTTAIQSGAMLTALGVGLIALGKKGVDVLKGWGSAAADYQQQAALTLTQIDDTGVKLEDIKRIGRDVAKAIPAPFEQMQGALYDIFSSMDVGVKEAETLLTAFAKGAVAGQTDVQTAGKATIAVMNAFKIPVEDVGKVMDTQFQLVRKGVGSYEEFAKVLGRVAPSAVRMGQDFETVGGMLAFLTRNGLNAFQASTSAARALDTLSKVKVQERLEKMGIAVRDATGEYRPLVDIVGDMNNKFKDLTKPERSKALEDLFFGAGNTVAARRFFDTVFDNFEQFEGLTADMRNSAGAMGDAYDIMFEQPQTQIQLMKNKLEVLRTEFGDRLLGAVEKLAGVGNKVLDFFGNMSEGSKDLIVKITVAATAFALIAGTVLTVIGVFLILKGIIILAGVSFVAVGAAVAIAMVWLIALAAIAFLIYKNWDTLGPIFKKVFEGLKLVAQVAWQYIQDFADWVMTWLPGVWENVKKKAGDAWDAFVVGAQMAWEVIKTVVAWLVENVPAAWQKISDTAVGIWQGIQDRTAEFLGWFQENVQPALDAFVAMVQSFVDFVVGIWNWLFDNLRAPVEFTLGIIGTMLGIAITFWVGVFQFFTSIVMSIWEPLWTFIKEWVDVAFNFVKQTIENGLAFITGIFQFFAALFQGDWSGMWEAVKQIASAIWDQITNIINTAFDGLFAIIRGAMGIIWQVMQAGWDAVIQFASTVPGKIWSAVASVADLLWDLGWKAMRNLLDAIGSGAKDVLGFFSRLPGMIIGAVGAIGDTMYGIGLRIVQGIINGIKSLAGKVAETAGNMIDAAKKRISDALSIFSPSRWMFNVGTMTVLGMVNGIQKMVPAVERQMDKLADEITGREFNATVGMGVEDNGYRGVSATPSNVNLTNHFYIYDAHDPEKVGQVVEKKLDNFYRELQSGPRR